MLIILSGYITTSAPLHITHCHKLHLEFKKIIIKLSKVPDVYLNFKAHTVNEHLLNLNIIILVYHLQWIGTTYVDKLFMIIIENHSAVAHETFYQNVLMKWSFLYLGFYKHM